MTVSKKLLEMVAIGDIINQCNEKHQLSLLYDKYKYHNHPYIFYCVANKFLILKCYQEAKDPLLEAVRFGNKYPSEFYDDMYLSDCVGQCLSNLVIYYSFEQSEAEKITSLAYLFLSKCIDLVENSRNPHNVAHDSLRTRARLLNDNENPFAVQSLMLNLGLAILREPFVISDFYYCSIVNGAPLNELANARRIHYSLEDISIAGKDADDYTLEEMAILGKHRHKELFQVLEEKYIKGEYNIAL
jgi:hypothetical protein